MAATKEVAKEALPWIKVYKDGTSERFWGVQVTPAGLDSETDVLSKDIVIIPETNIKARIYRPNNVTEDHKLPLLVNHHGGALIAASAAEFNYNRCVNLLVAQANIIAVSVDYRLAPENPLPIPYEDSWAALQWVANHAHGDGNEEWLKNYADFTRVFVSGDSAGANITHHLTMRAKNSDLAIKIEGIILVHPYFWGKDPIGIEVDDEEQKAMVDKWWLFVCPSDKGCDDPYINPFVDGTPSPAGLGCNRVLVFIAEKDILSARGKLYHEKLLESGWKGKAEIHETKGEDHVFYLFNPHCDNARIMLKRWATFIHDA